MGVGGQRHAPAALPPRKTRYPLYRRLGGSQGRSGLVRNILHFPAFDPRTSHPVASLLECLAIIWANTSDLARGSAGSIINQSIGKLTSPTVSWLTQYFRIYLWCLEEPDYVSVLNANRITVVFRPRYLLRLSELKCVVQLKLSGKKWVSRDCNK